MPPFASSNPPANRSVVDTCEREVRRRILTGTLRPGERLPSERALAIQLGVNRTTLRSALTRLATARLLQVRQGSGYVVQDFRAVGGLELLSDVREGGAERCAIVMGDLLALRRAALRTALLGLIERPEEAAALGGALAELAATGATDQDVVTRAVGTGRSHVMALAYNPLAFAIREHPSLVEALDREAHALASALSQWLARPSREALEAFLGELEARETTLASGAAVNAEASAVAPHAASVDGTAAPS